MIFNSVIFQILVIVLLSLLELSLLLLFWILGYRKGYSDCIGKFGSKKRNKKESKSMHTESETVRIVGKRMPKH